jgi:enterobactin synthetase component D / holo-[acyl-carrier protein] synthase
MTGAALLSSVLPDDPVNLASAELYADPPHLRPLPEEEPLIARSVAKRRHEFITARHCARLALRQLGEQPVPIGKGEKGEPRWPDGIVGSLTHTQGFRAAVVGRQTAVRSVGIDAEPHDVLPDGVLDAVTVAEERHELTALPDDLHWDRILFCAKEATYKAWFPLTRRWLGFDDAHAVFDIDPSDTTGTTGDFVAKILIDGAALSGPPLTALRGRWSVQRGLVLTAIVL